MKAKVVIEEGITHIVLTPESPFEKHMIEEARSLSSNMEMKTDFKCDYQYNTFSNHRIEMELTEKKGSTEAQ